jgi:hypothetical protein
MGVSCGVVAFSFISYVWLILYKLYNWFPTSHNILACYSWLRVTQSKGHAPDFERISVQPYQITSKCKFHVNARRYTHDSKYLKKLLEILLQDSQSRSFIKWEGRSRSVQVKAVESAALPTYRPLQSLIPRCEESMSWNMKIAEAVYSLHKICASVLVWW